jgi:hypothetical membrane protein
MYALVGTFSEGNDIRAIIFTLLFLSMSTFIFVVMLVIAWHWEIMGAILFIACALLAIVTGESWVISAILFLEGGLFLLGWLYAERSFRKYMEMK